MRLSLVSPLAIGLLVAGALSGCERAGPAPAADDTRTAPAAASPAPGDGDGDGMVTMRYACDGHRVAVFGNDHVTVSMDGRDIDLRYVTDSSPPRFAGEALEFSVGADGAVLGQDEGASWTCTAE